MILHPEPPSHVDVFGQRDWRLDPGRLLRPDPPRPALDVLAALDVPAPLEDWHDVCDAWGAPRNPDALVRAVQAAAYDKATASYLADQQARARRDT